MEGWREVSRRRRMVEECSSVIIPIVLLNYSQKEKDRGRGAQGREDITLSQEENPTTPKC